MRAGQYPQAYRELRLFPVPPKTKNPSTVERGAEMARLNVARRVTKRTHEGAPAIDVSYEKQLKRAVLSTMLWEDTYYESGKLIADRIMELIPKVTPQQAADTARFARSNGNLRHVPLWVAVGLCQGTPAARLMVKDLLADIIQRPDELCEFVALYWKDGKKPLTAGAKKGLAKAFAKFDEYQLAKYDRDQPIKLRDVMFLCHPKPTDEGLYKRIAERSLKTPDTWETKLSAGSEKKTAAQKREAWADLIDRGKLGGMAILRNLRNFEQEGVPKAKIKQAILSGNYRRVMPFRFITAARHAMSYEAELDKVFIGRLAEMKKLPGKTAILVDVSGSMNGNLSKMSEVDGMDAACGLAAILRGVCEDVDVLSFSSQVKLVPPRHGFALIDAIQGSQPHSSTMLGEAVRVAAKRGYDRIVAITDEQSHDRVSAPVGKYGYMINIRPYKYGVGYGPWNHIDGFSAAAVEYITEFETL